MLFCIVKDALLERKRAPFIFGFVTYWYSVSYESGNERFSFNYQVFLCSEL